MANDNSTGSTGAPSLREKIDSLYTVLDGLTDRLDNAPLPEFSDEQLIEFAAKELKQRGRSYILTFREMEGFEGIVPAMMAIPEGSYTVCNDELAGIIAHPNRVPVSMLPGIIAAAAKRLHEAGPQ